MPGRKKLEYRDIPGAPGWRVGKLSKPHTVPRANIRTDMRIYQQEEGARSYPKLTPPASGKWRTNLKLCIPDLGPGLFLFHRVCALAWKRGGFEDLGGVWRSLPAHVTYEGISSLHAEHGGKGTGYVLHDLLLLVTPARNAELEAGRLGKGTKRKRAVVDEKKKEKKKWQASVIFAVF